ncbi:amino acid transporter [Clostridium thermobutyricum]|uniref:amino acid transporter n=1 Tax=Clostridium thermobutyricum TaxID=29372 RepID=UPI0018AB0360|nr:amino acid transporter [Clostridium thermobutyricum]
MKFKRLNVQFEDGGKLTYRMFEWRNHQPIIDRYLSLPNVKSVILQKYPKKDNEPIIFK